MNVFSGGQEWAVAAYAVFGWPCLLFAAVPAFNPGPAGAVIRVQLDEKVAREIAARLNESLRAEPAP